MQSPRFLPLLPLLLLTSSLTLACASDSDPDSDVDSDKADWFWSSWFEDERGGLGAACGPAEPPCDRDEGLVCVKLWPVLTTHSLCEPSSAQAGLEQLAASKANSIRTGLPTECLSCDLRWADLSGARLAGAQLQNADLSWATLVDVDLSGANLFGADLVGAVCNDGTTLPDGWQCGSDNYVMFE